MVKVKICMWKACKNKFCSYIEDRLKAEKERFKQDVEIETTPCMGDCKIWPNITIDSEKLHKVDPIKASSSVMKKLEEKKPKDKPKKLKINKKK